MNKSAICHKRVVKHCECVRRSIATLGQLIFRALIVKSSKTCNLHAFRLQFIVQLCMNNPPVAHND